MDVRFPRHFGNQGGSIKMETFKWWNLEFTIDSEINLRIKVNHQNHSRLDCFFIKEITPTNNMASPLSLVLENNAFSSNWNQQQILMSLTLTLKIYHIPFLSV